MTFKIPPTHIPIVVDRGGKITRESNREWYAYWELSGNSASTVSALASGKIWIGSSTSVPTAQTLSGNATVTAGGVVTVVGATFTTPPVLPTYTVATVPSAATYARGLIYVSNETGGATVAFSDGTNWRRVQDLAIVS